MKAGAGIVRLDFYWSAIAAGPTPPVDPSNPGSASYDFSTLDPAVSDAEARGLSVMLSVTHAPTWAEGPGRAPAAYLGTWDPSPSALGDFMRAVASRYSGNFDPDGAGPQPTLPDVQATADLERAQPRPFPDAAVPGRIAGQPRPLSRDAERRLRWNQGGEPERSR